MKYNKKLIKFEEKDLVLKRCISTCKQQFLIIDKINNINQISSGSDREMNFSPLYNTEENFEKKNFNDKKDKNNVNLTEKNVKCILNNEKELTLKPHCNKKKILGNFLLQSNINSNFSPQLIKTKMDFIKNNNINKRNPINKKNSFINRKTNSSNCDNIQSNLKNNESFKEIITNFNSVNNSLNQNISLRLLKSKLS